MVLKHWIRPKVPGGLAQILSREYHIPLFLAEVLESRGIDSPAKAEEFLCSDTKLSDPFLLPDMKLAVSRITKALDTGEKITVYGDYDCDGVCATTILVRYFESLQKEVDFYIPSREEDGYGLNILALNKICERGTNLVITVDNGISALEEVDYASKLGMDLVITDHHQPGDKLPQAVAIVDPYRREFDLPFRGYAGAGIAFQLVRALSAKFGLSRALEKELLVLAAIATVGDVVPLKGENRLIVLQGLKWIPDCGNLGLKELFSVSGVKNLTSRSISFGVVPRINAAGRMKNASLAVELFLCKDIKQANMIARQLENCNVERQEAEKNILKDALKQLDDKQEILRQRVLVLTGKEWDSGVIGIVASRLLERFGKPVFLLSTHGDTATGSARSMEGFSVFRALQACGQILEKYGGHTQAGGLTIRTELIETFSEKVNQYAESLEELPKEIKKIDRLLSPEEVTLEHAENLNKLEPYGAENPEPVFLMEEMKLNMVFPLSGGKHTKLLLEKSGSRIEVLCFGKETALFPYPLGTALDLLVNLEVNEYGGRKAPSLKAVEIRPTGIDDIALIQDQFWADELCCRKDRSILKGHMILCREDIIPIYRFFRKKGYYQGDLMVLYLKSFFHTISYVKFRTALEVLRELGLIKFSEIEGIVTVVESPQKVSLASSKLFCFLQEGEKTS